MFMRDMFDEYRFEEAKLKILGSDHNHSGIGTLSEKTVHGVLKNYYEPDGDYQEVALNGYVADIFRNGKVIEIQTGNFNKMRDKLSVFLNLYEVKIVYPIPHIKYLNMLDTATGEITCRRKSPKCGSPYEVFKELYRIKNFLKHPNLSLDIVMLDIEEYRTEAVNRRTRKPTERFDRIPKNIDSIVSIENIEDYLALVPVELADEFTAKDYKTAARVSSGMAGMAVNILNYLGTIENIGKRGRAYLYHVKDI